MNAKIFFIACRCKLFYLSSFLFFLQVSGFSQSNITGKVLDENGKPLQSVSVNVKGSSLGTTTDGNGDFSIDIPGKKATFIFSYVGFNKKEVNLGRGSSHVIVLQSEAASLEQVIVVGYGTQKKVNLTGAVDQVDGKVLEDKPVPNALRGLQGVIPGLFIKMATGQPTQDYSMVVRGEGSIGAGGSALVLIDGVPGDASRLNPEDIQSVSVLKDAASAAIYGARGAFGVVLITTKDARKGKPKVNFSSNFSLNGRAVKPQLLTNGYLWAKNFNDAYFAGNNTYPTTINTGLTFSQDYLDELKRLNDAGELPKVDMDPSSGKYIYYGSTDWQKQLYADYNPSTENTLSISGGNEKADYYLSGRYFNQRGIFRHSPDTYKMYDMRAKGSVQVFPWLKVENNFSLSRRTYFYPQSHHNSGVTIFRRIADEYSPLAMLQNPDGSFTKNAAISFESFLAGGNYEKTVQNQFSNTASFTASFSNRQLNIHGDLSYVFTPYLFNEQRSPITFSDAPGKYQVAESSNDWAAETTHRTDYIGTNIYADYGRSFGKHSLKGMIGFNYENTFRQDRHYKRYGLINPDLPDPSLITGQDFSLTGGGYEWTTEGEFFRLNYDYSNRYLLEINGRYDGSSKFPLQQQFGFFPSASAGWRVTEEPFWNLSKKFITNLKLRASYGSLGNGNVSPYGFLETMPVSQISRLINGDKPLAINQPNVVPNGLTWEKVTSANLGIDAGFLDNRLTVTFDRYIRYTIGMFTSGLPLPAVFGSGVPKGNYADLKTNGWELSVAWNNKVNNAFHYNLQFTLSDNYSTVTRYNNPNGLINTYYEGERLGDIWGYQTDGLFKDEEDIKKNAADQSMVPATTKSTKDIQPGDIKFVDLDGDGKITPGTKTLDNPGDMRVIGNSQPRYLFGFSSSANWHNFDLSVFFQGIGKRDFWFSSDASYFWGQYNRPYSFEPMDVYKNQWSADNPSAYFPRLVGYEANGTGQNKALNVPTTRYLQNAAYIRLKNLSLGYNLPQALMGKIGLTRARMFLSGQNLWVWSPMFKITNAIDPEAVESESDADSYISGTFSDSRSDVYPILKTVTIGINLTF